MQYNFITYLFVDKKNTKYHSKLVIFSLKIQAAKKFDTFKLFEDIIIYSHGKVLLFNPWIDNNSINYV
jgi:hypothetical protein